MLKQNIADALNRQLNRELFSSYLYLSMGAYFQTQNLVGMAKWMQLQAKEELIHSLKILAYLNDRGAKVILEQIEQPQIDWESPLAPFEDSYTHECAVTGYINEVVDLAVKERDHATQAFLQWFVTEQVEEESAVLSIVERFRLGVGHPGALFILDKELGTRAAVS